MAIRTDTIITRYEAVTVSHEQGVERVKQKQQQLNLMLKDWNEEAKRVEGIHTAAWKKAGLALAGVTAAVVAGRAAFQQYAKETRLTAASAGVDIERLDKAAGGLQNRMELLEFAAKTQAGAFKLTTQQMVDAQQAIRAITRDGHEQAKVTEKITEAIVKLEGEGLKDFGIRVREAKTDTERFNAIMDALAGKARTVDGAVQSETESVQALGVRFENAGQKIISSLGRIVVAMTPLLEGVATLAEASSGIVENIGSFADLLGTGLANIGGDDGERELARVAWGRRHGIDLQARDPIEAARIQARAGGYEFTAEDEAAMRASLERARIAGDFGAATRRASQPGGGYDLDFAGLRDDIAATTERAKRGIAAAKRAKDEYDRVWNAVIEDMLEGAASIGAGRGDDYEIAPWAFEDSPTRDAITGQPDVGDTLMRFYGLGGEQERRNAEAYQDFTGARSRSKLESVFGPIQDFNAYATAFQTLQGAVGAAMGAWIDGSKSAAAAFKDFIGQALGGVAVQMAMEAIKHGAFAIGSLAFGDIRGAAQHGKAAAAFAAGAVIVGAAAKSLHGGAGASSSSSAGAAAPTYSPGVGGGVGATVSQTIVYGPDYVNQSARQRQLHAERMLNQAKGSAGVVYG